MTVDSGQGWRYPLNSMGPLHCPLCLGLALLSVGRGFAHAALFWQMRALPS